MKIKINAYGQKDIQKSDKLKSKRIIIEGITESGEVFRPTDWAERMSGQLSTFVNFRINYSPLLHPIVKRGYKCISLDPKLKNFNPELYRSILNFAKTNKLKICMDVVERYDEY